ncbi:unnamed protein product [Caenorhabditis bovis]|uniref:Galectin n=1 Tax=Caenorhabditis bovis TaxID=2654633 RepID=A0A8S1ET18_9PELO|nr:unnamed protein product [Caenorhabditis bovis]
MSSRLLQLFLVFALTSSCAAANGILDCDKIDVNAHYRHFPFARPMADGDEIIVRGTLFTSMSKHKAAWDLYGTANSIGLHFRMDFKRNGQPHRLILNTQQNGRWKREQISSNPFHAGQAIEIRAKKVGNSFHLSYGNGIFLKTYPTRLPANFEMTSFLSWGDWVVHNIEMVCKNPPVAQRLVQSRSMVNANGGIALFESKLGSGISGTAGSGNGQSGNGNGGSMAGNGAGGGNVGSGINGGNSGGSGNGGSGSNGGSGNQGNNGGLWANLEDLIELMLIGSGNNGGNNGGSGGNNNGGNGGSGNNGGGNNGGSGGNNGGSGNSGNNGGSGKEMGDLTNLIDYIGILQAATMEEAEEATEVGEATMEEAEETMEVTSLD